MTPIDPVTGIQASPPALLQLNAPTSPEAMRTTGFADIIGAGVRSVDQKIKTADTLVQRFTVGEDIPVHQVTYALEQARLSLELAMQVRGRLIEGYREIMNMQL